ncbi:hypothetical protein ACFYXS_27470 [Streptomyces sp. NPDC002574]|uniref:hypothetical protein n=1 Tax=Streptomyces sp. NPDC002574 TaxID=3364652 RepID=UPI00368D4EB9
MAGSGVAPNTVGPPRGCRSPARHGRFWEHGAPWPAGLRLRHPHGVLIRVHFLVAGDATAVQAEFRARLWASRLVDLARWRDALVDAPWAEVRRLRQDLIGNVELTGPFPGASRRAGLTPMPRRFHPVGQHGRARTRRCLNAGVP